MKKFLAFILLIGVLAAGYFAFALLVPVSVNEQQFVLLRPGSSARTIARQLRQAGVIRSWPAFLLLHYYKVRPLQAGEYLFDHPANMREVYRRLAAGDVYVRTVVIPEGYNLFDIAQAIEAAGLGKSADFINIARGQRTLVGDIDPEVKSLEGYLFPDTYKFARTQSLPDMAAMMVRRFRQEARALVLNTDVHRVVTMASIVEKETSVPEERSVVASVYYNRLTRKMGLYADPTVAYAAQLAGRYRGTIFQSDLQFDSPYNTYRYRGLPPGPVANPGRAALQAAMHPANSDFMYFVSDNNGHHRFARTPREHSRNVALYRNAQR
jgi:peptidoglycan lytic transglycosylase G